MGGDDDKGSSIAEFPKVTSMQAYTCAKKSEAARKLAFLIQICTNSQFCSVSMHSLSFNVTFGPFLRTILYREMMQHKTTYI